MLFGSPLAIHQIIPRPTLDVQFLGYNSDDDLPATRWIDRIICEENIIQAWEQLLAKFLFFMPKPFRDIDAETLMRRDAPPVFRGFREAAVNLLIHQDYGDHSRKAVIKFFQDGTQFWNPGDVFGDASHLWEPGEKEVRNPSIAMAFRRITMCEQAGTGLRMIREEWKRQGYASPSCQNDRSHKAFEFFLPGDIRSINSLTEEETNEKKLGEKPEKKLGEKPEKRLGEKPEEKSKNPLEKLGKKPEKKLGEKPEKKLGEKPEKKLEEKSEEKTREKILAEIAGFPLITVEELTERIGITLKGVEWHIRKLKSAGILKRIGPSNGGYWKVNQ
jgi:predicted HTH transcriptional regulator